MSALKDIEVVTLKARRHWPVWSYYSVMLSREYFAFTIRGLRRKYVRALVKSRVRFEACKTTT